ncbi:MAG: phage baseplate protein [Cyclobacteriaceae bacterium]
MKKFILLLAAVVFAASVQAQVGINNNAPDAKSILDLKATDKGLLIPRMTTAFRDAISSSGATPESLLVYDTDLKGFYFFQGSNWYSLSGWVKAASSNNVSLAGNASVSGTTSAGTVSATNLSVPGFANNALVPTGIIVMWSGTVAPSGWALCDGGSGRPDLRGKFIVGYNAGDVDYNSIGKLGGEKVHTLTIAEMPSHNHSINDPGHSHTYGTVAPDGRGADGSKAATITTGTTNSSTTGITINNNGGGSGHENRPPYYTLAYIIKL